MEASTPLFQQELAVPMGRNKKNPIYKRVWFPWVSGAIIVPSLGLIWAQINNVWSAPQEIKTVKEAVVQQAQIAQDLKAIVSEQEKKNTEQDAELEKQAEISQLQIDSLKALLLRVEKSR